MQIRHTEMLFYCLYVVNGQVHCICRMHFSFIAECKQRAVAHRRDTHTAVRFLSQTHKRGTLLTKHTTETNKQNQKEKNTTKIHELSKYPLIGEFGQHGEHVLVRRNPRYSSDYIISSFIFQLVISEECLRYAMTTSPKCEILTFCVYIIFFSFSFGTTRDFLFFYFIFEILNICYFYQCNCSAFSMNFLLSTGGRNRNCTRL